MRWWEIPRVRFTLASVTTMASACPNCGLTFHDSSAVLKHMNHRFSSCHVWFTRNPPTPVSNIPTPPPILPESHKSPSSYYFPGAGHVFTSGPGFMGWFQGDTNADARSSNLYYPFSSKGEWEIAAFLSRSGLSMKLIDEFLSLSLVSYPGHIGCCYVNILLDHRAGPFLPLCTYVTWKG